MSRKVSKVVNRYIKSQGREGGVDFNPNIESLSALEEVLAPLSEAQESLIKALTLFIKLRAPKITPDGMIGGKGFMMPLKDAKEAINVTIDNLSVVIDAIEDEIGNNPLWQKLKKKKEREFEHSDTPGLKFKVKEDEKEQVKENLDNPLFVKTLNGPEDLRDIPRQESLNKKTEIPWNDFEEEIHLTP